MASDQDESTTSGAGWLRLPGAAAWVALAVAALDLALLLWTAPESGAWREPVLPGALLVTLGLAFAGALVLLVLGSRGVVRGAPSTALFVGVLAGLVAAQLELVLVRFDAVSMARRAAWPSALLGLAVGVAVYLALRGRAPGRAPGRATAGQRPLLGLGLLGACVLGCLALRAGEGSEGGARSPGRTLRTGHAVPRVILIVVDTLRADAISGGASEASTTPQLDAFAAEGWRFTGARSSAPWTLPSVSSLLTGLSPWVHGATQRSSKLPQGTATLAEAFARAGYRTAAMGHNPVLSRTRRLDRGFDEYDFASVRGLPGRSLGLALLRRRLEAGAERFEEADELVDHAADWVERHAQEDFFLWMHFYDPHLAYAPPAADRPKGPVPPGFGPTVDADAFTEIRGGFLVPDEAGRHWVRSMYDGEVRSLDRELGRFFERLRALGLYDDALIVLTSDHGEEFWEHGGFEHGHTGYEELLRVPLVFKLPAGDAPNAGVQDAPVALESVAPSLLSLSGLSYDPEALSAPSLFTPEGRLVAHDGEAFLATGNLYFEDRVALLFDGWKYVLNLVDGREELYDLANDPGERLSLVEAEPERLAAARARCAAGIERETARREALGIERDGTTELSEGELEALRRIGYAR